MRNKYGVENLDPTKLIEVVPNRDPETSVRFSIPVPNWLDNEGRPIFDHSRITEKEKDGKPEWRFNFYNFKDDCDQRVKIDGDGAVIIMTPPSKHADMLVAYIMNLVAGDLDTLTPENLEDILGKAHLEYNLYDFYNENRSRLDSEMDQYNATPDQHPHFGSFLKKDVVSSALFLEGSGIFEGPAASPQQFENGAFIFFDQQPVKAAKKALKLYDPEDEKTEVRAKLVQKDEFTRTRRLKKHGLENGEAIHLENIPKQGEPKPKVVIPSVIPGFREYPPEYAALQLKWIEIIREVYSLYGFAPIETHVFEELAVLLAKGDTSKEMYVVDRLQAETAKTGIKDREGLRYDLTVPMARYVAEHYHQLDFPFKRQQIGKVWRGESPQMGRLREFYQCDIDVVGKKYLSLEVDTEFPLIMHDLVQRLGLEDVRIGINNRKILQGFYEGLGMDDEIPDVISKLDKLDKIGSEGVKANLRQIGLDGQTIEKCFLLSQINKDDCSFVDEVMALGVDTPLLREGLDELSYIMRRLEVLPAGSVSANLSIARDFSYYTGTIYEGKFVSDKECPTILAGGRYDNLVGNYKEKAHLPGVGISFGLSRVFDLLTHDSLIEKEKGKITKDSRIPPGPKTPTKVLVIMDGIETLEISRNIADHLRSRGIPTEIYHDSEAKYGEQLGYANSKGIPNVVFPITENGNGPEVKNMDSGDQIPLYAWQPK
jgi:histidyl-tRNA synthetase